MRLAHIHVSRFCTVCDWSLCTSFVCLVKQFWTPSNWIKIRFWSLCFCCAPTWRPQQTLRSGGRFSPASRCRFHSPSRCYRWFLCRSQETKRGQSKNLTSVQKTSTFYFPRDFSIKYSIQLLVVIRGTTSWFWRSCCDHLFPSSTPQLTCSGLINNRESSLGAVHVQHALHLVLAVVLKVHQLALPQHEPAALPVSAGQRGRAASLLVQPALLQSLLLGPEPQEGLVLQNAPAPLPRVHQAACRGKNGRLTRGERWKGGSTRLRLKQLSSFDALLL